MILKLYPDNVDEENHFAVSVKGMGTFLLLLFLKDLVLLHNLYRLIVIEELLQK